MSTTTMNLDEKLRNSLQLTNNSSITDATFRRLLDNVFAVLRGTSKIHNMSSLYNSKPDVIKEVYASLLSATAQFVRCNQTVEGVETFLRDRCGFGAAKAAIYVDMFGKYREEVEMALVNVGSCPDHVTDVSWKIDYVVKSANLERDDGPLFRIALQVEKFLDKDEKKGVDYVSFCCDSQELQDLVYKLKDAVRHCQRIGSEH